jgi:hypothetical protein
MHFLVTGHHAVNALGSAQLESSMIKTKGSFLKSSRNSQLMKLIITVTAVFATLLSPRWWIVDAGSDDLLFARQAVSLLNGSWLGLFQEGAGLKLPGFQLFLAISAALHVPYFILQLLLHSFFSLKLSSQLLRFGYSERTTNLVFSALMFSPALYGFSNSRLLRDGFYSVLLLGLITYAGEIFWLLRESTPDKRKTYFSMLIFSIIGAWLIFTREEGPLVGVFIFVTIAIMLFSNRSLEFKFQQKTLIGLLVFNLVMISAINFTLINLNKNYYGINSPALIQSGPLDNLIKHWSKVNPIHENSRISISYAQRSKVYEKIPEIGQIGPKIESGASFYQDVSCRAAQVCDEVGAGWISWAIYYAVQSESPSDTRGSETMRRFDYWSSLINKYCLEEETNCAKDIRIPGLGTIDNVPRVIQEMPQQMVYFFQMKGTFMPVGLSYGNQSNADVFRTLISFSGPPQNWPEEPLGVTFMPFLMLLFGVFFIVLIGISVYFDNIKNRFSSIVVFYLLLISIAILMRSFTTATIQITTLDTVSTQYLMPGVVLMWNFLVLLLLMITPWLKHARGNLKGMRVK